MLIIILKIKEVVYDDNIYVKDNILKNYTINSTLYNFYNNDNISMSSQIMSNCNKTLVKKSNY